MEWLSIESAPRNGARVLISGGVYYLDTGDYYARPFTGVTIAKWDNGHKEWNAGYGEAYDAEYWHQPTHWMPLPLPYDGAHSEDA